MRQLPSTIVLYRHLLRQSMALKDDVLRYYFLANTKTRFRQNINLSPGSKTLQREMSEAYTILRILVRANYGFGSDMHNLIGLAYGCFGPIFSKRIEYRKTISTLSPSILSVIKPRPKFDNSIFGVLGNHKVNVKDYPTHPRAMLSFEHDSTAFVESMSEFATHLPRQAFRNYKRWPLLQFMEVANMIKANESKIPQHSASFRRKKKNADISNLPITKRNVTFYNTMRRVYRPPGRVNAATTSEMSVCEMKILNDIAAEKSNGSSVKPVAPSPPALSMD